MRKDSCSCTVTLSIIKWMVFSVLLQIVIFLELGCTNQWNNRGYTHRAKVWPMIGQNTFQNHRSNFEGPNKPKIIWKYKLNDEVLGSAAIGLDGSIICGDEGGSLYIVSSKGKLIREIKLTEAISSTPVVDSRGAMFIKTDENLYAFNSRYEQMWKVPTPNSPSSPVLYKDSIIVVGYEGTVAALNRDGSIRWKTAVKGKIGWSSPAIDRVGTVYIGTWDSTFYALDSVGQIKWTFKTGDIINSSPCIDDQGTIYVGSFDKKLYSFDTQGKQKWILPCEHTHCFQLSISPHNTVYLNTYISAERKNDSTLIFAGKLYSIDTNGKMGWERTILGGDHCIVDKNGIIYAGNDYGKILAIYPDNSIKWEIPLSGKKNKKAGVNNPVILDDTKTLYVADRNNILYAVSESN